MLLTCPACGAAASLEAWQNDADWRDLVAFVPTIPAQLQSRAISYLGLFRSGKRALKPAKALKILTGLRDLVMDGTVYWEHNEPRPAPLELWAQALDAVIERRPGALTNHNYLKHTAWEMAASLAVQAEREHYHAKTRNREEEQGRHPGEGEDGSAAFHGGEKPKRRGCFKCESFRPPKGCGGGSRAVSGNLMLGCDKWKEKAAAASAGDLMAGLVERLSADDADEHR